MGRGSWSSSDWDSYSRTTSSKPADKIFTSLSLAGDLDPKAITVREARDSADHPDSTPIIIALDVTGSMGMLSDYMVKTGLGKLVEEILARKPVNDPQIMFMGVGDAFYDRAPLQVTQFESDNVVTKQLEKIYLEKGGGGNHFESYNLPWYFAAMRTQLDCVEKGRRKGLLFTIGDEEAPPALRADQIRAILGDEVTEDMSSDAILAKAEQMYDVFHVVVEEGSHCRHSRGAVFDSWNKLIGQQRVIPLADHRALAEVIVSAIEVHEGRAKADVAASWDGSTNLVVAGAVKAMTPKRRGVPPAATGLDVVEL